MKSLMLGIAFLVLLLSTQQAESFSVVPEDCMPACHNEQYCCRMNYFSYDCFYFPHQNWQCSEMITTTLDTLTYTIILIGGILFIIGFSILIYGLKNCARINRQHNQSNQRGFQQNRCPAQLQNHTFNENVADTSNGLPSYNEAVKNNQLFFIKPND